MEKKMPELASQATCLGCHACEAVCPTRSITFQGDGFFTYPCIDNDTCIQCGKCEKACTYVRGEYVKEVNDISQTFYCAYNNDAEERAKATSGGAGGALAQHALDQGWLVCGAAFDEAMRVKHILSDSEAILDKIRGSKYLQSDVTGVYEQVREAVKEGRQVLFFGTPCQCQALVASLPTSQRASVLTCAIICHGVNSAKVWEDNVRHEERKTGKKIVAYNFRSKDKGWGPYRSATTFQDKQNIIRPSWNDLFLTWFGHDYIIQEACFHCPYRIEKRAADLTIGDFWGVEKILPSEPTRAGLSVLIASTNKGKDFVNKVPQLVLKEVDENLVLKKALKGYVERRSEEKRQSMILRRKAFEAEYAQKGFDFMAKKYPAQTYWTRIIHHIRFRLRKLGIG
ncbi:MAG: Coenzyme F420 hydrogenase/dehydrogenase, beta subunit C-terminal domain [Bacteroidaceae bacterium]|nr:Coenzyme F420 hydrogenase/dehydrogenase, beta subunit C-terminal domain [Bacteroidaceae bacterium]